MERVAAGDTAAFAALYDRHHRSVARFAHRFVQDAGKAEELTQDIFVKLYRHAGRYRATARFNEHRPLIRALFKHPPARRILFRAMIA